MLNLEGLTIDRVRETCSPDDIEPLLGKGFAPASNSNRSLKRPPCFSSRKTSADEIPSG